jgi:peptide deformylase
VTVGPETWNLPSCLRRRCDEVPADVDPGLLETFIGEMFEVLYKSQGVGLAAPQVGVLWRLAVIDVRSEDAPPFVMINPAISERSEEMEEGREGCLSIPAYVCFKVPRSKHLRLTGLTHRLEPFDREADGFLARVIQHEYDHLDGILYPDRLASLSEVEAVGDPVAFRTMQTMGKLYRPVEAEPIADM